MQTNTNPSELPLGHEVLTDRDVAIKVVGVGGAGSNAVDRLKMENLDRLQMAVINTDLQALSCSPVQDKILIGSSVTRGLGAGGDPELGLSAAESDREKIAEVMKDCDLVFLIAGMGGGTGSGASSVVAEVAAESGALVIAFVTMPFSFEGGRRVKQADEGLAALRKVCDAVIPLPNDILLQEAEAGEAVLESFARADAWMGRGVKSIWSMLHRTGLINLDFATLRQVFQTRGGKTLFGLAHGAGEDPVADVLENLKLCPLLATPEFARKADRLLVNLIGGPDLTLARVNEIMTSVTDQFGRNSHVIMGAVIDEDMKGQIEVVILGTTDVAGRSYPPRRTPAPTKGSKSAATATAKAGEDTASLPITAGDGSTSDAPVAQDEFTFGDGLTRGFFDKTDRNLFEGQDLDVPTYLRRGIKLML